MRGTRRVWLEAQGAGVRDARRVRCYAREEGRATRGGSIPSGRTDALRHLPHIYIHTLLNIPIFCNGTYNFLHSAKLMTMNDLFLVDLIALGLTLNQINSKTHIVKLVQQRLILYEKLIGD